jgi:hypothetical protein
MQRIAIIRNILAIVLNLIFIFCSTQIFAKEADEGVPNGRTISSQFWFYRSYSQQKMGYPLRAGYPVVQAQGVALNGSFSFRKGPRVHTFSFFTTAPTKLSSDNGQGENFLLAESELSYYKAMLGYKLWLTLFDGDKISLKHNLSSGVLFEYRNLPFLSGTSEKTGDINLYLGPCFRATYDLNPQWQLSVGFDAHFYLPYFNYGSLSSFSDAGEKIYASSYRAFYYQTNFILGFRYAIDTDLGLRVAISKDDLVGFANRKPSFKVNDIIHHKLDRVFALTVGVDF